MRQTYVVCLFCIMELIKAKTILAKLKNAPDNWFGLTYNMNLYRGCQHQCIYCDSRSECYRIQDFSKIQVKDNALNILETELKKKKVKGTIGTGSMNDPYMPIEKELKIYQAALQLIQKYHFPVHVITKSNLVVRDAPILQQIAKTYAAVSFTITTLDDELAKIIEPGAPLPSARLKAIEELSAAGIYCGVLLMPLLPFINDTRDNITQIVEQASKAGAQYIIEWMGMTLRDQQRDYFYQKLDENFPGIKAKYIARYQEQYSVVSPNSVALNKHFIAICKQYNIARKINIYKENKPEQLSLF